VFSYIDLLLGTQWREVNTRQETSDGSPCRSICPWWRALKPFIWTVCNAILRLYHLTFLEFSTTSTANRLPSNLMGTMAYDKWHLGDTTLISITRVVLPCLLGRLSKLNMTFFPCRLSLSDVLSKAKPVIGCRRGDTASLWVACRHGDPTSLWIACRHGDPTSLWIACHRGSPASLWNKKWKLVKAIG